MGRQPCCDKIGLKRGPWTMDEDQKLINFILNNGIQCWRLVPMLAGLKRCGKSCRLRWTNYLRPDLKRGALSEAEENQIIQLHSRLGNRWSKIAAHFPGRTDNEIKNHWNTRIKKRLKLLGLDPVTHKPIEQPSENCDTKVDRPPQSNPREDQKQKNKALKGATTSGNHDHEDFRAASMKQEGSELGLGLGLDDTSTLLHSYGMLWESMDMEDMKPQANITSFSLENSLFPFMGEASSPLLECSKLDWEDTMDSFIS